MSRSPGERTVLVTGSTRGIGRAVARKLVEEGADVVVNGRDAGAVEAAAGEIDSAGPGTAVGLAADLTDPAACEGLVSGAVDRFGRLDTVVNNAGLGIFKPITEMSVQEWRTQVETNLGGPFYVCRAAMSHLIESEHGFVINVGSLASRHAFAGGTGYNASKFGLLGMTEAMMADVRALGVRVSMLMPGSVQTGFGGREESDERSWRLQAEEVADAVVHMLSYPEQAHVSRIEMRPSRPGS